MSKEWDGYALHRYRQYTPAGVWNIPVSPTDLHKAGKKYAESLGIPQKYNRKFEDAALMGEVALVAKKARPSSRPLKVGDLVYYRPQVNRGTKKWPDIINPIRLGRIVKIDPKTMLIGGYAGMGTFYGESRIDKNYVLGRMTARKK